MTIEKRLNLLKTYFFNRTDKIAVLASWGKPSPASVTDLDPLLGTHLLGTAAAPAAIAYESKNSQQPQPETGHYRVGSYAPAPGDTTRWLCLDFDGGDKSHALVDPTQAMLTAMATCEQLGLPCYGEVSGGGQGWHLWLFFNQPVPAAKARKLGLAVAPKNEPLKNGKLADPKTSKGIEIFPKQDHLPAGGIGNFVWLPWWSGASGIANKFAAGYTAEGEFQELDPEVFETVTVAKLDEILAQLDAGLPAHDTASDEHQEPEQSAQIGGAVSGDGVVNDVGVVSDDGENSEDPDATMEDASPGWKQWRQHALSALPIEVVYGNWLTGQQSGPWLQCRDPLNSETGDQNPSAGVAGNWVEYQETKVERGAFHSFITAKTISVFDFLIQLGQADSFVEAAKIVADLSGVPLPAKTNALKLDVNGRANIVANCRQLRDIVRDARQAIEQANTRPYLFRRAGQLVMIRYTDLGPEVKDMDETEIYGFMARVANWKKVIKGKLFDSSPPKDAARDILAYPPASLPVLEGVVMAPVVGKGGQLVSEPGYHAEDRVWLHEVEELEVPPVPEQPTAEEVAKARYWILEELLADFPFVSSADLAHAVAAMLLPFARRMIKGSTPLHLFEAPSVGSGKGLLCNLISVVATGDVCAGQSLSGQDEEVRKMLTAELRLGRPIILLDNVDERSEVNSPALAAALTSDIWTDRVLGTSEKVFLPNRALWLMTGNNPRFSLEIARRIVRVRIDPKTERPWLRGGFKHPEILEWSKENRGSLIWALLVLIQKWLAEGRPAGTKSLGSFGGWAHVIGGILKTAGIEGFLDNLEELYEQAETELQAWGGFVALWWKMFKEAPKKATELNDLCESHNALVDVRGDGSDRSQTTRLGRALQQKRDRVFGGLKIDKVKDSKSNHNFLYRLVPVALQADQVQPEPGDEVEVDLANLGD